LVQNWVHDELYDIYIYIEHYQNGGYKPTAPHLGGTERRECAGSGGDWDAMKTTGNTGSDPNVGLGPQKADVLSPLKDRGFRLHQYPV